MPTNSNIRHLRGTLADRASTILSRAGSQSDKSVLLRGTAGNVGLRAVSNGMLFGAQLLFANYLGAEGFGIYILALAWMNILLLVGRQGFDIATVRFVASYKSERDWPHLRGFLNISTGIVLAGSVLSGLALAVFCLAYRSRLHEDLFVSLIVVAGIIPLFALLQIKAATLRGLGHVVLGELPHAIVHPVALVVLPVIGVTILGMNASPGGIMGAYLVSITLSLLVVWAVMRHRLPKEIAGAHPAIRWREWLLTAPAMILIAGFGIVLNQIGAIMLGIFATPDEAGIFGASSRVASILQLIVFALISTLAPMAARLHSADNMTGLQRAIGTTSRLVFSICLAGAVVLLLSGHWILGLFGAEFRSGYMVMAILLAGQLAWAANAPAGVILNMGGRHNISAVLLGIAVCIDIVLSAILIPSMGANGAAIANAVTIILWNIATAAGVYRCLGIRSWVWPTDHRPRTATA